jgi:hypothetical protein
MNFLTTRNGSLGPRIMLVPRWAMARQILAILNGPNANRAVTLRSPVCPEFLLVIAIGAWFCHARDGCYGAELRGTRRRGRCDHRRCGRRPTRRGSGSRHGCRCRSPSPWALAWSLLLASWPLLGSYRRAITPGVFPLLPVDDLGRA